MLENLNKFLRSNKDRGILKEIDYGHSSRYTYLLRVESGTMGVQLIYKFENQKKDSIGVYEKLEFEGIYDYLNQNFYIAGNYFPYLSNLETGVTEDIVTIDGTNLMRVSQLVYNYKDYFRAEMISKIGTDETKVKVDVTKEELENLLGYEAVKDALNIFMDNKTSSDIDIYRYVDLNKLESFEYSEDLYLKFLGNPSGTIKKETEKFIKEKRREIYFKILKTKEIKSEIERLEKDEEMIDLRNLLSILNDESRKSLNVLLEIDGKEVSCKIETARYNHDNSSSFKSDYISEYNIVGADKSEKIREFKSLFGGKYRTDAPFSSIKEITYSRRVLYTRK